jgi:GGDEF domain-containing protein
MLVRKGGFSTPECELEPNGGVPQFAPNAADGEHMEGSEDGSVVDQETGLPNREGWNALLEAEEQRAKRHGGVHGLVLVELELTATDGGFVEQVAAALTQSLRETDHLARVDRRTFGVLALHCDSLGTVIDRIRDALEGTEAVPVVASIDGRAAGPNLRTTWWEMTTGAEVERARPPVRYVDFVAPFRSCLN